MYEKYLCMKKVVLLGLLVLIPSICFSQKRYVLRPQKSAFTTEILKGVSIKLDYRDARILPKKAKIQCSFDEITGAITETLSAAGADVTGGRGVEVKILQYEVFARGVVWIGLTTYEVDSGGNKHTVKGENSEGNVLGMKTAKSVLSKSFDAANKELINFISENR
jgi:hypothetical protein